MMSTEPTTIYVLVLIALGPEEETGFGLSSTPDAANEDSGRRAQKTAAIMNFMRMAFRDLAGGKVGLPSPPVIRDT
jgi:hypothetical protein